jgi:adenylate kinase family enzyme
MSEKDGEGKSILISAVNKPSLLKIILESLPESLRLDTVQEKDKHGRTMLMDAAYNPESLKIVLDLYPTNEDRLNAIKKTNENTWSIKSHKGRFDLFSDLPRDIVNKKSILMIAASNPETLKIILDLYPTNEELLEVLKEKDAYGNSTLMYAASNPETLKIILDLYPTNEELLEVLKEKNNAGESTLMYMVSKMDKSSNYSENLKMILTLYPTEERLNAIRERNRYGNSILMNAAINFKNLKMIIDLLPEHQRFEAVKEKYGPSQNSILFSYAEFDKLLVKVILETLPADITMVIRACAKNLNKNDFEKLTFSMLDFMANMKELATPETINHFVHAVIINQDIEPALTALLSPPSSSSFFKSDSKVAIQECISKLDSHWLERISKVVHDDPTIDAPKKF